VTPLHQLAQDIAAGGVDGGRRDFGWEVAGAVCRSGMWSPLFCFR
jgi:hypothetical protein